MKRGLYRKLAADGIRKNQKIYFPYFLTCAGMIMMFYIVIFLATSPAIRAFEGGSTMQTMLGMGVLVMGVFACIFLCYTSAFLMRRRKKEFGLYNMLGMGKKSLLLILLWENIFLAAASFAAGLFCGILFSKAGELLMVRLLEGTGGFSFHISAESVVLTLEVFGGIFLVILVKSAAELLRVDPVELFRGSAQGEKPPRINWLSAVLGLALLGGAYWLAVMIEDPMAAILWFFLAVVMVIVGTYLLFMAGSVALCRILQKNKRYYYKTSHFISVSSMAYRMKKNGAGLASICILSTMVLVMVSAVICMFAGVEDSLKQRYPRDIVTVTQTDDGAAAGEVRKTEEQILLEEGAEPVNILNYHYLEVGAYQRGDSFSFDVDSLKMGMDYTKVRNLYILPLSDYNRVMGKDETLAPDEALIYSTKGGSYGYDTFTIEGCGTWRIRKEVPEFVSNGMETAMVVSSYFLFLPTEDEIRQIYEVQKEEYGEYSSELKWYYGFDLKLDTERQKEITERLKEALLTDDSAGDALKISVEGLARERIEIFAMDSGMFFIGILLGLVFIAGTVLIMYYKQITEGYEDQKRFEILQKVGMTRREIKKSINSQILTVFFLPLLAAGVHTAFAFPFVRKILLLFSVTNTALLIAVTAACYLAFAGFYVLVYLATSRAYYGIVSGGRENY